MHDIRYRKPQALAEFFLHIGSALRSCTDLSRWCTGRMLLPLGQGHFLGFQTWVKLGCCCHPQEVQLSPSTSQHIVPVGADTRLQADLEHSLLQSPISFWACGRTLIVPCCHTAQGCPTPSVDPNATPMENKTLPLS